MSQTATLAPVQDAKLVVVHGGVMRQGFVLVGGDPRDTEEEQQIRLERTCIRSRRDGCEYTISHGA